jgi:CAAX prenyl protease-like protein
MPTTPLDYQSRTRRTFVRDDLAYILPMAVFLLFTQIGVSWPSLYQASYVAKTLIVAAMLVVLWPHYTKIRWDYWWLGIIFGVLGVVQWVGMEKLLLHFWPHYPRLSTEAANPFAHIHSDALRWTIIGIRWGGAFLLVPVMEELFWRDFLWRTVQAPNDFKLAKVGETDWMACLIVSLIFSAVHIQWMTAIVWGLMVGGLLMLTRSLGACIIMHAVTNFLLGWYVLRTGDWYFW